MDCDSSVEIITEYTSENSKLKYRLGNCEVCSVTLAKYTCPKCEVKTCCLNCLNIHKKELACDGIKDNSRYIPLPKFTDTDLGNDYRFLEQLGREVEKHRKTTRSTNSFIPKRVFTLKTALRTRGITWQFLPPSFARHKKNKTHFDFKTKSLFWTLEWVFPCADNYTATVDEVLETQKIGNIASRFFHKQDDKVLQGRLQYYQAAGLSKVVFLLKGERKGKDKFFVLDKDETLNECLQNKCIIEYPIIYVIFDYNLHMYEIISNDDELMLKTENRSKHGPKKRNIGGSGSTCNYLFSNDSDVSDEDN